MTWAAVAAGVGALAGAVINNNSGKAKAPATVPYNNVNSQDVAGQTINSDLANLPAGTQLAQEVNKSNVDLAKANQNAALPGFSDLQSQNMANAQDKASNLYSLPKGAIDQILQTAAENNISGGTGAISGFSQDNSLRSLGVNIQQYGQQQFQDAMQAMTVLTGTSPNVSPVSPLSFMLTPTQTLGNTTNNNLMNQNIGQGGANNSAAAANYNSANLWDSLSSQIGPLSSAVGNAMKTSGTNSDTAGGTGLNGGDGSGD